MIRNSYLAITVALILPGGRCASSESRPWAKQPAVPLKINDVCQPIAYSGQRIHPESLLGRRLDVNLNRGLLGAVDLDSYLRPYLEGKRPFWPSGKYLGKFMQAYSRMYQYTGNGAILAGLSLITRTWANAQKGNRWLGSGDRWGPGKSGG